MTPPEYNKGFKQRELSAFLPENRFRRHRRIGNVHDTPARVSHEPVFPHLGRAGRFSRGLAFYPEMPASEHHQQVGSPDAPLPAAFTAFPAQFPNTPADIGYKFSLRGHFLAPCTGAVKIFRSGTPADNLS